MPIYRIDQESITPITRTTFDQEGIREREDIQRLLKQCIDVISPDTLVIAEEFCDWEDSRRRIDLLGIDKAANLVVIELKRTEDGGHMELQALRYAAMISTLTFEKLIAIYVRYLKDNGMELDAEVSVLEFLGWSEPNEDQFAQEVKIVLASAEFSKELTASVMWLNDFRLDIRCVRMHPYVSDGQVLVDVQTVIPIPEVADYQVRIREKKLRERQVRTSNRDFTKYDVEIGSATYPAESKRWLMYRIVSGLLSSGIDPQDVIDAIPWRRNALFEIFEGELTAEQAREEIMKSDVGGKIPRMKRYFSGDGEVFHFAGKTYVLINKWGARTSEAVDLLQQRFPDHGIKITPS